MKNGPCQILPRIVLRRCILPSRPMASISRRCVRSPKVSSRSTCKARTELKRREVTHVKSSEGFADLTWAADGHSLLYAAGHHLWRVPVTGGRPEKLNFAQDAESVTVARAGNRLAYAQVRHPSSIWQLGVAGQRKSVLAPTKLIASSRGDSGARISPDGQYIAFQSYRSGSAEVWISDRSGSNPLQLTSFGGAEVGAPSWAPDSRRIVFDVRTSSGPELLRREHRGRTSKSISHGNGKCCRSILVG